MLAREDTEIEQICVALYHHELAERHRKDTEKVAQV